MREGRISELKEKLRSLIVKCVRCSRAWLVSGLQPGDEYACKECGHRFVIKRRAKAASLL